MSKKLKVISADALGNEIVYSSLANASKATGASTSNIAKVCKGTRAVTANLRWRYEGSVFNTSKSEHVELLKSYTDKFLERVDFKNIIYTKLPKRSADRVEGYCTVCSSSFNQKAADHVKSRGCPKCSAKAVGISQCKPLDTVIEEFISEHGDTYDYSHIKGDISARTTIELECNIHGKFNIKAAHHRRGGRCPRCSAGGFKMYLPATLYYLRVSVRGEVAYKIGITNRTVRDRYTIEEMENITVLKEWEYPIGHDAARAESSILSDFKVYKWKGSALLNSGNTELFDRDVLELDNGK